MLKQAALALSALVLVAGCNPKDTTETSGAPAGASTADNQGAASAAAEIKPAIWKTGDSDTTIYLFGTVHVLPPGLDWRTGTLVEALDASKAVYFETDVEPDPAEISALVTRLGAYKPPETLRDHLTPQQREDIAGQLQKVGISLGAFESFRPWLVATLVGEQLIQKAGYTPESGVEQTMLQLARQRGKEIRKLETVEQQLRIFADLPEQVQVDYLVKGVDRIDEQTQLLHDLVAAWARGDVDRINHLMIEEDLAGMPEIYDALLVKRNKAWTEALGELVRKEPGVFFMAVGAAHLVGDSSVIALLGGKGMVVERIE
jgi:uncharacterized protein YbaP (TraB family)